MMGGDDGGAWIPYNRAREMMAAGELVTDLTIGDHDIKTAPDIIRDMLRSAAGGKTGYTAIPGTDGLRRAVAERIETWTGVATGERNVIITNGGQGALFTAHLAVLNHGDRALYGEPYYPTYPNTIRAAGGRPDALPMRPELGFQPDSESIDRLFPGARSILLNSPNNPTGAVYPRESLEKIADAAERHGLWVISDEVYDTQVWQGDHVSIRSLPGMRERTFVIGSMSKAYAMTGFRVGWLAGPSDVIGAIEELVTVSTFGVPEFIQEAAQFALMQGLELEQRVAAPFRERRAAALQVLKGRNAVSISPPGGAMYLMLDIRPTGLSGKEFAKSASRQGADRSHAGREFRPLRRRPCPHRHDSGHRPAGLSSGPARFARGVTRRTRPASGWARRTLISGRACRMRETAK